ncbi:MAG: transcription-repair coupling factor [Alphaproteobacteria bacterium]
MKLPANLLAKPGLVTVGGAPEGVDALSLATFVASKPGQDVLHLARDDQHMARIAASLAFFAPDVEILTFPAWDCLPYDRVSPNGEVVSRRVDTLTRLAGPRPPGARIVIATINAFLQRVPAHAVFADTSLVLKRGGKLGQDDLIAFLNANGYGRVETVREPGEYAIRGGLLDLFATGAEEPVRIDLFGDVIENLRGFDPLSQRSTEELAEIALRPVGEMLLNAPSIERFRTGYRELFGAPSAEDGLYEAVSAGRRYVGMEHWLPLFHEKLETLADYLPDAVITLEHQVVEAADTRLEQIEEFYAARRDQMAAARPRKRADDLHAAAIYNPLPPDRLYLTEGEWRGVLKSRPSATFSPFDAPGDGSDAGGRKGPDFAEARARADSNLFDAVRSHIADQQAAGRHVVIAAYSVGSRDRLGGLLREHGLETAQPAADWHAALAVPAPAVAMVVLGLEGGFTTTEYAVLTEQDILGDRMARSTKPRRKSDKFITEASSLAPGDLVVHVEHGVGRYDGLITLDVGGAPHDCLCVIYDGGDKLFVPVENIEVLSRFGSEEGQAPLDKLGGAAWQSRKARVKKRILEIAGQLIRIAAARHVKTAPVMHPAEGLYGEFCARFPYPETDDQLSAIEDVMNDLASGKPMDRLICGDVGFGKTEVALRAVFTAALSGYQAAIAVPTTLLARQHFATFSARFKGLPVKVAQLSRLVSAKDAAAVKAGLASGEINIVVGTHAILAKSIQFKNLGLVVVDEEQHFGVQQKERLKELRTDVHMLTLTATPIPRTLQLALTGVRDMSLIATPPVDRLAVRTFVMPYDPVILREAIQRERTRGGQVFYVCPRIEDLGQVRNRLAELVPDVKVAVAHGQMAPTALENVMTAFYDRAYDVLLSTNIVESGLDIPTANTLVIHRADMFGLSQLYQLRGRIGRSKVRAYAYLTIPQARVLREGADRRLQVMQTLDTLGAGFTLASHDMDIRGAGNLLGEEQSGHIREVGIELYQNMLEEAVAELRASGGEIAAPHAEWTPQITVGTSVLIPETYVRDLGVRLGLYRRLATLQNRSDIDSFAAELIDRFGSLPQEVKNLLEVMEIKQLCMAAGVEKLDAGPRGAVVAFRNNRFANPDRLVALIQQEKGAAKLRPDHKLVFSRDWGQQVQRIAGLQKLVQSLADAAAPKQAA